jgi:hypothetical protein
MRTYDWSTEAQTDGDANVSVEHLEADTCNWQGVEPVTGTCGA